MIQETPIVGKIYKVKFSSGRTWLFNSAYSGGHLTAHQGAYCINDGGSPYYTNRISRNIGCHVGDNDDIISLIPANLNEIAIFNRKLCL